MSGSLRLAGLACGYGTCPVVTGLDWEAKPGRVTALLGPNGSGKSTLLRTVAGLLRLLAGSVSLGNLDLAKLPARELARNVATVPQEEPSVFPFSVREAVVMGRLPRSSGLFESEEDFAAAERAMEKADCLHLADRPVTRLSGGERQRVLLARALAQETPVLLMDEPTSHLDVRHQAATVRLVRELAREGRVIVAAIHDLGLAALLADDAVLLSGGRVAACGPIGPLLESQALEDAYRTPFARIRDEAGVLRVFPAASAFGGPT